MDKAVVDIFPQNGTSARSLPARGFMQITVPVTVSRVNCVYRAACFMARSRPFSSFTVVGTLTEGQQRESSSR